MTIPPFVASHSPEWCLQALEKSKLDAALIERNMERDDNKVVSEAGCDVLLHSRRDPEGEAFRQVSDWLAKMSSAPTAVLVLGFGFGWHVACLAKHLAPDALLLVVDPNPALFLAASRHCSFTELEKAAVNVRFLVASDVESLVAEVAVALDGKSIALPSVFKHPACARAYPNSYAKLEKHLALLGRRRFADVKTNVALSGEWLLHAVSNIPLVLRRPGVEILAGVNEGGAAVLVAAGPSLDGSLEFVRKMKGRAPIICVGTALKSLLAKGVTPDFVIVLDSDPRVAAQFEGLEGTPGFLLLAPPQMPGTLLNRFKDRLLFFSTPVLPGVNAVLDACGGRPFELATGGTVALSALDFAKLLGSKEIFLAGLDLAMASDGRSHSSGSVYDGMKEDLAGLISIPGNFGGMAPTTPQFAHYVGLFDIYLMQQLSSGRRYWNLSRSGAKLKGTSPIEEKEALALADSCRKWSPSPWSLKDKALPLDAVEALRRLAASLGTCSAAAGEASSFYKLALRNGSFSGAVLARLNALDKDINSDNLASCLCGDALRASSIGILSGKEEQAGEMLKKGQALYESLSQVASYLTDRISVALRDIEPKKQGD